MNNKFIIFLNNTNLKSSQKNKIFINNSQKFKNIFVEKLSNSHYLDKNFNLTNPKTFLKVNHKYFNSSAPIYEKIKLNLKSNETKNNKEFKEKIEKKKEKKYIENNFYSLPVEKIGNINKVFKINIDKKNSEIKLDEKNFVFNINEANILTNLSKSIENKKLGELDVELLNKIIEVVKTNNLDIKGEIKIGDGKIDFSIFSLKPKQDSKSLKTLAEIKGTRIIFSKVEGNKIQEKVGSEVRKVKQKFTPYIDKENYEIKLSEKDFVFNIKEENILSNLPKNIKNKEVKELVDLLNEIIKVVKTKNPEAKIEIKFNEDKIDFKIFSLKLKEENDLSIKPTEIHSQEIILNEKKGNKILFFEENNIPKEENLNSILKMKENKSELSEITNGENKFFDFKIVDADINLIEKNEINFKSLYNNLIYKIKETLEETAKIKIDNKLANAEIVFNLNDNEKLVVKLTYTKNQDTVNIIFISQNEKILNSIKENMNFFTEIFNRDNINVNIFLNQNTTNFKEEFLNYSMWQNFPIFEKENKIEVFNYTEGKNYINLELDIFV